MLKPIIFVLASIGIIAVSRRSLRDFRSHGFYRFFAIEFLVILILLNANDWFSDPFSLAHVASWLLLIGSFFLAVHGFHLLLIVGKPSGKDDGTATLGFENTTTLVTVGAYRYIRHPLYGSLLLFGWGTFLKSVSFVTLALIILVSGFLIATAKAEEKENLQRFGIGYGTYTKKTKMFIPFFF